MSDFWESSQQNLNDCGCCEGVTQQTPVQIENRPGLSTIAYRVGTHPQFRQSLLASLSKAKVSALQKLTTRADNDFAIALLDAWATVADVLTFYQEQIANESYLRTAKEQLSLLHLAQLIGYKLNPGVAANTYLAFTLEDAPGVPRQVMIETGTKVQSIPGVNEQPQIFETVENIQARTEWNVLKPRSTQLQSIGYGSTQVYLQGTNTGLKVGDGLLVTGGDGWDFRLIQTVNEDRTAGQTMIAWEDPLTGFPGKADAIPPYRTLYAMRQRAAIFGHNAPSWRSLTDLVKASYLGLADPHQLVPEDREEWPNFTIYAPKYPLEYEPANEHPIVVMPTADSVAAAIMATAHAVSTSAATRLSTVAAEVARNAIQAGNTAAQAAQHIPQAVINAAAEIVGAVATWYNQGINNTKNEAHNIGTEACNFATFGEILSHPTDVIQTLESRLIQVTLEHLLTHFQNLEANLRSFKEAARGTASITELYDFATTSQEFARHAEEAVQLGNAAIGADVAANIVAIAVKAALEAPPPLAISVPIVPIPLPFPGLPPIGGGATTRQQPSLSDLYPATHETIASVAKIALQVAVEVAGRIGERASNNAIELIIDDVKNSISNSDRRLGLSIVEVIRPLLRTLSQNILPGVLEVQTAVNAATDQALQPGRRMAPHHHQLAKLTKDTIDLDREYSRVFPGSWVVLSKPDQKAYYKVEQVTEVSRTDFSLSAKTTRITLSTEGIDEKFAVDLEQFAGLADSRDESLAGIQQRQFASQVLRATTVFLQSEQLELAEVPITDPIAGNTITLNHVLQDAEKPIKGQPLAITGKNSVDGEPLSQVLPLLDIVLSPGQDQDRKRTQLILDGTLQSYQPESVTISANVVPATHGETKEEVLGDGDAHQSYQRFKLSHFPLTYVSAQTPNGAESTLKVRVNDLRWHEAPMLYGNSPGDRIFVTHTTDDGKATIEFGDGKTGARLPTGQNNLIATYRKGLGRAGNLKAGQLTSPLTRPLGVRSVTNPVAATGGDDPEPLEQTRRNASLTVLTLDRIVSLQDYEDFAAAFAGIAKALATWTWNGEHRGVFVTVAGPDGAAIAPESKIYRNLLTAMQKVSDPYISLQIQSYRSAYFRLAANIKVDSDFIPDRVLTDVQRSLQTHFGFDARQFGQGVAMSEVIAVMQAVAGVVVVDVDQFFRHDEPASRQARLLAAVPQVSSDNASVEAAELLTLDPQAPDLRVII